VSRETRVYRYGLFILFLVCTVSYLDRQIVTILAEPIKRDLHLSDTQLGLLTGFAFGIVYCTFGVPIARLADRVSRLGVLSVSLVVWSLCTMLCGVAPNLGTLVAARAGVGIGEAGSIPTGLAVATDYAPREKRASALAFFAMGTPVGSLLGLALGGVIASAYGWRAAFFIAGVPGILLAVLVTTTLQSNQGATPTRSADPAASANAGFSDVLRYLLPKRTFWLVAFGAAVKAFIGFGQQPFMAAFFLRVHSAELMPLGNQFGLKPIAIVGIAMGVLSGVCGSLSNWLGGVIADHYAQRDLRAFGSVPAIAALVSIPFACTAVLAHSTLAAFAFLVPTYLLNGLWFGPGLACVQGVVPREFRATASSIALFVINIAGFGFGALALGALSDTFQHSLGFSPAEGVRWALLASSLGGVLAAMLFWRARRYIQMEMVT
jgi:predicted MFS family arabinose efflux permease